MQKTKCGAEVVDLATRMLVLTGKTIAFAEVPVVEGERHETARRHRDRIVASRLLLHARERSREYQCGG